MDCVIGVNSWVEEWELVGDEWDYKTKLREPATTVSKARKPLRVC
jgi:hypothetical protein